MDAESVSLQINVCVQCALFGPVVFGGFFLSLDRSSLCVWVLEDSFRADRPSPYGCSILPHDCTDHESTFHSKGKSPPTIFWFFVRIFHVCFDLLFTKSFTTCCRCKVKSSICIDKPEPSRLRWSSFFSTGDVSAHHVDADAN